MTDSHRKGMPNCADRTIVGKMVLEWLDDYPTMPTRRMARALHHLHPDVFASERNARSAIGYYRGRSGARKLERMATRAHVNDRIIDIPEPAEDEWRPYIWPAGRSVIAIGADMHIPYHDKRAVQIFGREALRAKATHMLLDGDTWDCYHGSTFQPDPTKRPLKNEIRDTQVALLALQDATGAKLIYKAGNHESRLRKYIIRHAPALLGTPSSGIADALGLHRMGIDYVDEYTPIKVGKLGIVHGTEFGRGAGSSVNPARGQYLKTAECAIVAHWHRTSEHTEPRTFAGEVITCWSLGCLCQLHPEYAPMNKWNHGFAVVTVERGGRFHVNNVRMHEGKMF